MSIKIDDLMSFFGPGWIAMDSDKYWFWFKEKPSLENSCRVKFKNTNDEDLMYTFDGMKDKSEGAHDKDVSVDYVRSSREGNRVNITNCLLETIERKNERLEDDFKKISRRIK